MLTGSMKTGLTVNNYPVSGQVGRYIAPLTDDDFIQAGALYSLQSSKDKTALINNVAGHLKNAKKFIQDRQIANFKRANIEYGNRVEQAIRANSIKL